MNINEYLRKYKNIENLSGYEYRTHTPQIVCKDGFSMSVQASKNHYCSPRINDAEEYGSMEIGFPSEKEDLIMEYAETPEEPTGTVYGWVPCEVIDAVIEKHGGFAD